MNEAWKIFFEMYFSNGADIFVFVIAPMLWVSSMFIVRRHINCWQVSKTTCFLVMYGHVFINLLVLLLPGDSFGSFGNAIGVWVLLVVVACRKQTNTDLYGLLQTPFAQTVCISPLPSVQVRCKTNPKSNHEKKQ